MSFEVASQVDPGSLAEMAVQYESNEEATELMVRDGGEAGAVRRVEITLSPSALWQEAFDHNPDNVMCTFGN